MRGQPIDIRETVRGRRPRLPFADMKRAALGEKYELSLVICGDHLSQRLNREHRRKSYVPNVLSFPFSRREGEIFLNPRQAAREARTYGVSERNRLALLFVHGLLHLKGLSHGRTMEHEERRILRTFGFA